MWLLNPFVWIGAAVGVLIVFGHLVLAVLFKLVNMFMQRKVVLAPGVGTEAQFAYVPTPTFPRSSVATSPIEPAELSAVKADAVEPAPLHVADDEVVVPEASCGHDYDGSFEDLPSSPPPAQVQPAPAPAPAKKPRRRRNAIKQYRGKLVSAKWSMRPGHGGNKPFRQFCVKMTDPDLGERDVWGNDLSRAISEAGVQVGMEIEVQLLGAEDVPGRPNDDGSVPLNKKFLWEVSPVAN